MTPGLPGLRATILGLGRPVSRQGTSEKPCADGCRGGLHHQPPPGAAATGVAVSPAMPPISAFFFIRRVLS